MTDDALPPNPPIDVLQVMAEIEEEARLRRASGDFPEARERELDELFLAHSPASGRGGDLNDALARVDGAMFVDPVVPVDSNRRTGAAVKKGMRSLSLWYVGWVTRQISQFAMATSRSLHIMAQRLGELERDVEVQRVPYARVVQFPELHHPDAWWVDPAVAAAVSVPGRTLHAACDDGWLVRRVEAAGGDAYGVDPRADRVQPGRDGVSDVRVDEVAGHLRAVAPDALGSVILSGVVDGMAGGERTQLLELVTTSLGSDGVLIVHSVTEASWHGADAPVEADLSPGRPLRAASWPALLNDIGYDATVQLGPDEADFLVIAVRRAIPPPEPPSPPA
jgi:hypothetical protein